MELVEAVLLVKGWVRWRREIEEVNEWVVGHVGTAGAHVHVYPIKSPTCACECVLVEREGPAPYQNLPRGPVVPARHPDSPEPSLLYPIGWGVPGGSPRLFLLDLLQTTCQPETFPLLLVSVQGDSTLHVPRLRTGKLLDFEEGVVEYADAL
jgi:hypothetical protein